VQKVIGYDLGKMPFEVITYSDSPVSDVFEKDLRFAFCRGQGMRYSEADHAKTVEYIDGYHYNFAGAFKGYCCFCAMHAGFGTELFLDIGCYSCKQKHVVVAAFIELTKSKPGESVAWRTHGWAALPSVIIDKIVAHLFGNQLVVEDGVFCLPTPSGNME